MPSDDVCNVMSKDGVRKLMPGEEQAESNTISGEKLSSGVSGKTPSIACGQSGSISFDVCTAHKAVPIDVFDSYMCDERYERNARTAASLDVRESGDTD